MRSRIALYVVLLTLAACACAQEMTPAEAAADFRSLGTATGRSLEKECARLLSREESLSQALGVSAQKTTEVVEMLDAAYSRAKVRDRYTLTRFMALMGDTYDGGYPFLIRCGDGLQEQLWYSIQTSLKKALEQNPEFLPRLLRDDDPSIVTTVIDISDKRHNEPIRRALLAWIGSPNPRFRILPAFYMRSLPMDKRALVVDRMLDDPDALLRRKAITFIDPETAIALFPRLRRGFAQGSSGRKIGILYLGCCLSDPTISQELALARTDPDPEVRKAAKELELALRD
jgi:hypothetical protein